MNKIPIFLTLISIVCIIPISSIPDSDAKLWDFVVEVGFLKNTNTEENNPTVVGTIFDHAYRPLSNVDVKITFAGQSYMLETNSLGEFEKQLEISELKPRTYSVHVLATTDDGKKGMAKTTLKIDGHVEKAAKFQRQLDYMEMIHDSSKLRKNSQDPISVILYEHYMKLQENIGNSHNDEKSLNITQEKIKEIRQLVYEKLMIDVEKHQPTIRNFDDSSKLSRFLQNLDDDKRTLFELQLNSTQIRHTEAQNIMQDILKNGGNFNDARQAYLEHLSITQEEMNLIIKNIENPEISSQSPTNSTKN